MKATQFTVEASSDKEFWWHVISFAKETEARDWILGVTASGTQLHQHYRIVKTIHVVVYPIKPEEKVAMRYPVLTAEEANAERTRVYAQAHGKVDD